MRAVVYEEYGGPEVLHLGEVEEPHAAPGEVRIRVAAAAINPFDSELRSGAFDDAPAPASTRVPGLEASGVVDEVGAGVDDLAVGDLVFGGGSATLAEYAVLHHAARVPAGLGLEAAAGLPVAVETATRVLRILGLGAGEVVVLDGASGGVGTAAVQLAVSQGLRVVATASPGHHERLRDLGAVPTTYGPGLPARVRALVDAPVAGAVDLAGHGGLAELAELTDDPSRVVTIADFSGSVPGVHVSEGGTDSAWDALATAARLVEEGRLRAEVAARFPWTEAAEAYRLSQSGHAGGKIIVTPARPQA
ncbi:NADP-dependent oxidoreductase [Nocardioides mangrovicus]|uniref:NADP-dependent oxidoreductase n=1 Tax=Nocardioides mangrovicus TaxID=2478913 RepID=A0A3L8P517_9ACTN|nr:NADP-dependent oxidoreductase [Nocardioides mangrovicus]RLV49699.1 NADP-dependent oxidoreductase [Nocardioides mangrovicus]